MNSVLFPGTLLSDVGGLNVAAESYIPQKSLNPAAEPYIPQK